MITIKKIRRLLPSKPESTEPLAHLGKFLDEWQRSLLDIPIDTLTKEDEIGKGKWVPPSGQKRKFPLFPFSDTFVFYDA